MTYTTVLWDLDGTILNSGAGVFDSLRKTCEALGIPIPSDDVMRTFVGPPMRYTFNTLLGLDEPTTDRALDIYREFYLTEGAMNASLYPGVIDVIAESKASGKFNSLATSKASSGTRLAGEHFGFLHLFDFLGTAEPSIGRHTKTDVITYALNGLRDLGANLDRVILVGDRIHDVEGARDHNLEVVLVQWGFGNPEEWALADYTVSNTDELRAVLGL